MPELFARIPGERIGVLVGPNGCVKERLEKKLQVELDINSQTGDVTIKLKSHVTDPSILFRAKDYVIAVGRGFSPERAFQLIRDEDNILTIIDLREIFGRSPSEIKRVKGRIIGKEGKTRRIIEELSDASISIYGYTVAIIGAVEQCETSRQAIDMLIKGSQHTTVYKFLQRKRHELKKRRLELWEGRDLVPAES